jgi:hypothetical protein
MTSLIQKDTIALLKGIAHQLREGGFPEERAAEIERLSHQVDQPCVVAVVGRVNAGKSTFINALLRDDKAVVGTTETTATVNYFSYGVADPRRPVRCHWRAGQVSDESADFLDLLQGNDYDTLRRADGIEYLEYLVPNPLLKQITLVDTPGTGAVVSEHQERTAEFLRLTKELGVRRDQESQRIHGKADAVIYLVGSVALSTDKALLEEFTKATGGRARALNAVGVVAKIDLSAAAMLRRHELARKVENHLSDVINTCVPVSAALSRTLDRLSDEETGVLTELASIVRSIPTEQLSLLLDDEELFCELELEGVSIPPGDRRALYQKVECPWGVFRTVVNLMAEAKSAELAIHELREQAGFDQLRHVLERNFLQRGQILRCYRIASDAKEVVKSLRFIDLQRARSLAQKNRPRLDRFLMFLRDAKGDPEVAAELTSFVQEKLNHDARIIELEQLWRRTERDLSELLYQLREHNADFEGLQTLDERNDSFTASELEELRALLGLYGIHLSGRLPPGKVDSMYAAERQLYWRRVRDVTKLGSARWNVADRAYSRLGLVLAELEDGHAGQPNSGGDSL